MVWMRKEVILLVISAFLVWMLQKSHQRKSFWAGLPIRNFIRVFLATIVVSFLVSVFINQ
jgi:hypothetical protein